jgi:quercetin dioxygenase-like cupin family protein
MQPTVIRWRDLLPVDRGMGIRTLTYADAAMGAEQILSGRTIFPANTKIPHHTHSREELVIISRGRGILEIEGRRIVLETDDASFVPPNVVHRFVNESNDELELTWTYGGVDMVRTIVPEPA